MYLMCIVVSMCMCTCCFFDACACACVALRLRMCCCFLVLDVPLCVGCRMEWDDKSSKFGEAFSVEAHMSVVSTDALRRAKDLYEILMPGWKASDVSFRLFGCSCMCVVFAGKRQAACV